MTRTQFWALMALFAMVLASLFFDRPPTVWTLTPNAGNGEIVFDASAVQPGDIIKLTGIAGKADIVRISNLNGDSLNRITITVDDTLVVGETRTNYAFWLDGQNFTLQGMGMIKVTPSAADTMSSGISMNNSNNWTIDGVDIYRCKAGIIQNPEQGGRRTNIAIRNIRFYNLITTSNGTGECVYLGSTALKQIGPHQITKNSVLTNVDAWFDGVLIENCYGYGCDGDFIQVAMSRNVIIRNCHVWNYGRNNISSHKNAYIIGGSTAAVIENCSANTGSGPYVQVFGFGLSTIRNCNFNNGATGHSTDDGIYINKTNLDPDDLLLAIENTTINGANRHGINNTEAVSVTLCNVNITSTAAATSGLYFSTNTTCLLTYKPVKIGNRKQRIVPAGKTLKMKQ